MRLATSATPVSACGPRTDVGADPRRRATLIVGALLLLAAVASTHGRSWRNEFVAFDDDVYVYANPHVAGGFTADGVAWAFRLDNGTAYFHPLTWLSLMADASLFGRGPLGFHLVNVLMHGASAVLLFLLLSRRGGRPLVAAGAAMFWALHPVTVEAVAWAAERKAVLSTLLGLAACHAYVSWAERPGSGRGTLVVGLSALAMLAKPSLVVLPALFLILDGWMLGRFPAPIDVPQALRQSGKLLAEKLPLLAVTLVVVGLALVSARLTMRGAGTGTPMVARIVQAFASLVDYLGVSVWPSGLAVLHPSPVAPSGAAAGLGLALALALSAAAWFVAGRLPAVAAGWLWFLVSLAPYLGLLQNGLWPAWAERFAYLPEMGLAVAFAALLSAAWDRFAGARPVVALAAVVAVLLLGAVTWRQVGVWRSSETLFLEATRVEPEAAPLNLNYGRLLIEQGRLPEAKARFLAATAVDWRLAQAQCDLGTIMMLEGDLPGAEARYRLALAVDPGFPVALYSMGEVLVRQGRLAEARAYFAPFVSSAPPSMAPQVARAQSFLAPGMGEGSP